MSASGDSAAPSSGSPLDPADPLNRYLDRISRRDHSAFLSGADRLLAAWTTAASPVPSPSPSLSPSIPPPSFSASTPVPSVKALDPPRDGSPSVSQRSSRDNRKSTDKLEPGSKGSPRTASVSVSLGASSSTSRLQSRERRRSISFKPTELKTDEKRKSKKKGEALLARHSIKLRDVAQIEEMRQRDGPLSARTSLAPPVRPSPRLPVLTHLPSAARRRSALWCAWWAAEEAAVGAVAAFVGV